MQQNQSQDSIQVYIRIRPGSQQQSIIAYSQNQIKLDKHQFAFDKIFSPACTQNDIFHHVGSRLLNNVLDGYNSCVFVYGQTGSGKTHTMIGDHNGLMQQSFRELFSRINRMNNAQCLVTCSYFELYNEQIMDLLDPKKQKKLNIRQDVKKGVFVENLTEQTALDCQKLMDVLYTGMKNRHIGQTQMNRQSSRSHSVFTICLSCKIQQGGKFVLKTPKLHFVDLAGSQRQKMTQASGDRLKQAGNINRSLTTLGMVINALTSEKPRTHIPYRDSKLTCLLRDSLGGNSKTIIIATVSCAYLSFQQTLSTLNFANRAKMVKVSAQINEQSLSGNIQSYKEEIRRLKAQLIEARSLLSRSRTPHKIIHHQIMGSPKLIGAQIQQHFEEINKKINAISEQISQGVISPSLQNLVMNLNSKNNKIYSRQTLMEEQNINMGDNQNENHISPQKYNSDFIEYLNSNYELLTQINQKVNQYLEIKQQLKSVAMSKKLSIQSKRTPSKFERDQYEQLLNKREEQIRFYQEKVQMLQNQLNIKISQKNDAQRKLMINKQKNQSNSQQTQQIIKESLLKTEQNFEIEKGKNQIMKNQILKSQKIIQQLQQRLTETKQLYIYAEQKYENQQNVSNKYLQKIKVQQQELNSAKKKIQMAKQQIKDLQNQIQNLKLTIQQKQSKEEQLKNQLNQLQETLEFNKKMIHDLTKKLASTNNQFIRYKEKYEQLQNKNNQLQKQKILINQRIEKQKQIYQSLIDQKNQQIKQFTIQNDKLYSQIFDLNKQLNQQKEKNQKQINQINNRLIQSRGNLYEKENQINKYKNQLYSMQDNLNKVKKQSESNIQSMKIKLENKCIQLTMNEQKYIQYKTQAQNLIINLKKNIQSINNKNSNLQIQGQNLRKSYVDLQTKFNQSQNKFKSVQLIYVQNQQLKYSYKELVRQNYKLKGKYRQTQNQQIQKQKNQQLLAKVQFYQEKFKLMSIQYQNATEIIKKLKQRQLQKNKKISFYQQNLKLISFDNQVQQKKLMINELKQENRQLKGKLDNLQSNIVTPEGQQKLKRFKEDRQLVNFTQKQQKLRIKLNMFLKKWQGYLPDKQYTTQKLLELCQQMLNQQQNKFETISKNIKREQKLKSQNHFILKENIYLKEKVQSFQKNLKPTINQLNSKPRKIVKID